jgi:glycosyltransferase involved in cell wall biosynthesis
MRIAQLYHDFSPRGGAERHVETLTRALGEQGHQVTIVSRNPPSALQGFAADFARCATPFTALRLARWMRRERIELVHAHSRITAWTASLAARLCRIPLVVTSHILPRGMTRLSRWGDATICVSEAVRRRLIEVYGVPWSQTTVIHNGVELARPAVPAPCCQAPQPVISCVARFSPGKGQQTFLEAASHLIANGFPGTFMLAGDGPLERGLRHRYASERIRFLGHRSDVPSILAGSTASVVCSESEAFPYVVLESLAVGTPVVSTDCGGPAEAIQAGHNGFLYPIGDTESLLRLLVAVCEPDSGLASRPEIAEECRTGYSCGRMVEATLRVYRGATAGRTAGNA